MRVGERGIELPSVAMQPVAHRALEGGIGPGADTGLDVGRDVGRVDRAERRLQRAAAVVERAADCGVALRAIAECGQLLPARDRRCGIDRWVGPRDWRNRAPRQERDTNADRGGADRRNGREDAGAFGERIFPDAGWLWRSGSW